MSALDELTVLASSLENQAVKDWKRQGKKVVGFFCTYIPEEILYAADILPYRVRATDCTETTSADVYMSHLNCSFVRSCLQYALEDKYRFLDGLVFANTCDDVRRLYDLMRTISPERFPFMNLIDVPKKADAPAIAWYKGDLERFKKDVEKSFGTEITQKKLKDAIEVYNQTRSLLRKLYELRQSASPPLTGAETLSVVLAATAVPRDQYNKLLQKLLKELPGRKISDYKARLIMAGTGGCDDRAYLQIMEDLGGLIVSDTDCFGSRYFWEPVATEGDLMQNLATAYMKRPSCARMVDGVTERLDFLKDMAKSSKADGVVFQSMHMCQVWGSQLLNLRTELKKADVPLLILDKQYALSGTGQLKTRVQAFIERIER